MKFLIVGLGNIGPRYRETRHNIGFKVADALIGASDTFFIPGRYGDLATVRHRGKTLIVLKPNTFMNLSGKAVNYWLNKEKIPTDRLLIVTDDINLPFGKQRLRMKGSDGGHNGLRSIIETLGNGDFARLRIGVGNEFAKGRQVDYVLGEWDDAELENLDERIAIASETVLSFAAIGGPQTMTLFNAR